MIADALTVALDSLVDRFAAGDDDAGNTIWLELFHSAVRADELAVQLMGEIVARLGSSPPLAAAQLALLGGALVENDVDGADLATALRAPLIASMRLASAFIDRVQARVDADNNADNNAAAADNEADEDGEVDDVVGIVHPLVMAEFAAADPEGHAACASLNTWFRPVVACWSRIDGAIKTVRADDELMELLTTLEHRTLTSWMATLAFALQRDPFVVIVPELQEGWSLRVDGVVDVGQLSVLLSAALSDTMGRLGLDVATDEAVATMQGEGPQQSNTSFACALHLWPWQAFDVVTGMPAKDRYTWCAPGGSGSHSLPSDYRPGELTAIGGVRVLFLTGKGGDVSFTRNLPVTRSFSSLPAEITGVRRLSADELSSWLSIISRA